MSDDALDVIERVSGDLYVSGNKPVGMALAEAHGQLLAEREAAAKDREDAERYRWIKPRLLCAGFNYDAGGAGLENVLVFSWPVDIPIGADLDKNIDAAWGKP